MTVKLVTKEKIAETSSKGNQEKWYDKETDRWYKLDQFGYEALSETLISKLLERSNIEKETSFTFVRYEMEKIRAHGRKRTGCSSKNFSEGYSIITVNHLLGRHLGSPLKDKLESLTSDKKRIEYLAEKTKEVTGLEYFPQYLTLLFEIDAMFLNDEIGFYDIYELVSRAVESVPFVVNPTLEEILESDKLAREYVRRHAMI